MKCIFLVSRWTGTVVDSVAEYSVITELQFIVLLAAFAVGWRMLDERCSNKWMVWMGIAESKGVLKKMAIVFVMRLYHLRHNQPCLCFIYYTCIFVPQRKQSCDIAPLISWVEPVKLSEKSFVLFIKPFKRNRSTSRDFVARSAASRPKQRPLRSLTYSTLKFMRSTRGKSRNQWVDDINPHSFLLLLIMWSRV